MTAPMIRADAPELLALVEAFDHLLNNYLLDEHDEPDLCVDDEHWSAIHDAFTALAAWEAIAPKPSTDALTPWGILPDGSGLDPATLPIHRGGKASDNA